MIGIYKIENLINHHCYIGQSVNISKRWRSHKVAAYNTNDSRYEYPIYKAIRKYGLSNFSFEVLEECSKEKLNEREIYWIEYYNSWQNGYNQTPGGDNVGNKTFKLSKEQVEEIKTRLMNLDDSIETNFSLAKEYNVSDDTIRAINHGRVWYDEKLTYPLHNFSTTTGRTKRKCIYKYNKNKDKVVSYAKCCDCGKLIQYGAKRCVDCYKKYNREQHPIPMTRDELKNLIRTTPFTRIGAMYDVTDNTIRKWCDRYSLPRRVAEIKKISDEEWVKI